jgi:hypothetical protein
LIDKGLTSFLGWESSVKSPLEKVAYTFECHRVATPLPSRGGVPEGRGGVCNILSMKNLLTPPPTPPLQGRGVPCGLFRYRFTDVQTFSSGLINRTHHMTFTSNSRFIHDYSRLRIISNSKKETTCYDYLKHIIYHIIEEK